MTSHLLGELERVCDHIVVIDGGQLARFWTIHHHVVHALVRVSRQTIMWNFLFLATISLLPFCSLAGGHI